MGRCIRRSGEYSRSASHELGSVCGPGNKRCTPLERKPRCGRDPATNSELPRSQHPRSQRRSDPRRNPDQGALSGRRRRIESGQGRARASPPGPGGASGEAPLEGLGQLGCPVDRRVERSVWAPLDKGLDAEADVEAHLLALLAYPLGELEVHFDRLVDARLDTLQPLEPVLAGERVLPQQCGVEGLFLEGEDGEAHVPLDPAEFEVSPLELLGQPVHEGDHGVGVVHELTHNPELAAGGLEFVGNPLGLALADVDADHAQVYSPAPAPES